MIPVSFFVFFKFREEGCSQLVKKPMNIRVNKTVYIEFFKEAIFLLGKVYFVPNISGVNNLSTYQTRFLIINE